MVQVSYHAKIVDGKLGCTFVVNEGVGIVISFVGRSVSFVEYG